MFSKCICLSVYIVLFVFITEMETMQSNSSNSEGLLEVLKKQLSDERMKKIQVRALLNLPQTNVKKR